MPRFAANLSMLFTEAPFLARFERAAQAGFAAVEFQFPYAHAPEAVAEALQACGLPAVLHNLPAGDWAAGDRGLACDPVRVAEFEAGVAQAIRYAQALGVKQLNCLAGIAPAGVSEARQRQTLLANLTHAAAALNEAGVHLLIEPINHHDVPGFVLNRSEQVLTLMDELLERLGLGNIGLQYDLYHAHRMGEDLSAVLRQHLPRIAHLQVADVPGRHEPGTGEIAFPALFAQLDAQGYSGWVGAEYLPRAGTEAGLVWMQGAQAR